MTALSVSASAIERRDEFLQSEDRPPRTGIRAATNPSDMQEMAQSYVAAGISVFPLRLDGSKAPASHYLPFDDAAGKPSWNVYRSRFATREELARWFRRPAGTAIVCGKQSGGLEVLDFDERADETFSAWWGRISSEIRRRLCVCKTGGGGYHVPYRCDEVCGNTQIAMTEAGGVLVESRGEGGYVVAVGSPADVHTSRRPYAQVAGPLLPELPILSRPERRALWEAAAALDERPDPLREYVNRRVRELKPRAAEPVDTSTPWGDFAVRATWDEVLTPAGWVTADGITWTRPGKRDGTSAKVCIAEDGVEVLTVFSGNAGALAPQGTGHRTWGKFEAFAALYHGGDRREATRAARAAGYGRASR